ncbi:MAG: hypothetical protein HQ472_05065 [Ignavibacteria bacterium]|nr:hypothetical protein [Ignavibacteria bacterium]
MDWFDAFDEVFASVERYANEHGKPPHELAVSSALYNWIAELQHESDMLGGMESTESVILETPHGKVPLVINDELSPYEIIPQ